MSIGDIAETKIQVYNKKKNNIKCKLCYIHDSENKFLWNYYVLLKLNLRECLQYLNKNKMYFALKTSFNIILTLINHWVT